MAGALVKTFDLKRVALTVNGIPIRGFQDGDAIAVETDNDLWTKKVGVDGEVARAAVNDRTGKITINLLYSSSANATLNNLLEADKSDGTGIVDILVEDTSGGFKCFAAQAWVLKHPSVTLGSDVPVREWVMDCGQLEITHAGITPPNVG